MRFLFRVLMALVLTAALLVGMLFLLPGEKIARLAADQVQVQTGRSLDISGDVRLSVWPVLGVKTGPVAFQNADWLGPDAPPMIEAAGVSIGVALKDLLSGDIRIKKLVVAAPRLHLSTNEQGVGNWEFGPPPVNSTPDPASEGSASTDIAIEYVELTDASVTWAPHGAAPIVQDNMDLTLLWPNPAGAADLMLTLKPASDLIEIEAELGTFSQFLAGQVASIGATIRTASGRARFDGRASLSGDLSGRLTGETSDADRLARAFGQKDLDPGAILEASVSFGTDVTYTTDGRLSLRDTNLKMGQNEVSGAVDLNLAGAKPMLTAKLDGDRLDLSALAAATDGESPETKPVGGSSGWSSAPIDASALGLLDASIDVKFNALALGGTELGQSKLNLSIDRARAVLSFAPATVFGGTANGQLVANNRNGLSVGGKLSFDNIELSEALNVFADSDKLNGRALGQLEFLGVGENMDAIMRSLSGSGWVEVGKGFFTGFDLEDLMRSGGGNGGSTVFESLSASYTMKNGDLINPDLLMRLKRVRAEGAGRIGLGAQDLDYTFTPILEGVNARRGLRIPVRIKGSWDDPSIRPDLDAALDADIDRKKDELEDKARAKLGEELKRDIAPEEDLEDAIKDGLEEKAVKELLKIFGAD